LIIVGPERVFESNEGIVIVDFPGFGTMHWVLPKSPLALTRTAFICARRARENDNVNVDTKFGDNAQLYRTISASGVDRKGPRTSRTPHP